MIVIKKHINLDFLGKEYEGSYLVCRSISINESEKMKDETVQQVVIDHFIEGKIKQGAEMVDITLDNIKELNSEALVEAFNIISGKLSPKSNEQL